MPEDANNALFNRLESALQSMLERQESVDRKLAVMTEQLSETRNETAKLRQVLHYGNGSEPLIGRVSTLERTVGKLDQASTEAIKGRTTLLVTMITSLTSLIIALFTLWSKK